MAFKPPAHHYSFKEIRYRDPDKKRLHAVKLVLPKQEDGEGRYLFEFLDGSGKRAYLEHHNLRAKNSPYESHWGS